MKLDKYVMNDLDKYKRKALMILSPIKEVDKSTQADKNFLFNAKKSKASFDLPDYFLIYFLFSDLLGFKNLGKFDKVAWSFPIDYNGKAYLVEYRKFGVGVFVHDLDTEEEIAREIVNKINSAVKSIGPYYDFLAGESVKKSEFNIINNNRSLFERFDFLLKLYKKEFNKYIRFKDFIQFAPKEATISTPSSYIDKSFRYRQRANWLAISCIEAFFSWTEHLFIHLTVVAQNVSDGEYITRLIDAEWKDKFLAAIKEDTVQSKRFYNELLIVRQQLRNFVAHGAFGKNGNAFRFHSETGAVPVLMKHKKHKNRFSLNGNLAFKEEDVIHLIEDFIKFMRNSKLAPAMYYTQDCELPSILTLAKIDIYKKAMTNMSTMKKYCDEIIREFDKSADMDW